MSGTLEKLLILQDRDIRIRRARRELNAVPRRLEEIEEELAAAREKLEKAREAAMGAESERRQMEMDVDAKREQIAKYQNQLLQIKSNEEYRALTSEIEVLKRKIEEIEDQELVVMERVEELLKRRKEAEAVFAEAEKAAEERREQVREAEKSLRARLVDLEKEREELAAECDPTLLARYKRILDKKGDIAVVPVEHGACGGCHLKIPPQTVNLARRGDGLVVCDYCGRIVYFQES